MHLERERENQCMMDNWERAEGGGGRGGISVVWCMISLRAILIATHNYRAPEMQIKMNQDSC